MNYSSCLQLDCCEKSVNEMPRLFPVFQNSSTSLPLISRCERTTFEGADPEPVKSFERFIVFSDGKMYFRSAAFLLQIIRKVIDYHLMIARFLHRSHGMENESMNENIQHNFELAFIIKTEKVAHKKNAASQLNVNEKLDDCLTFNEQVENSMQESMSDIGMKLATVAFSGNR